MILYGDKTVFGEGFVGSIGGYPTLEGHRTAGEEGHELIRNNKGRRLDFGGVTVRGWNSTNS